MTWTEARYRAFIVSVLRSGTRRYPPKYETLNEACVGVKTNSKTGRPAKHYKCASCSGEFPSKEVQVDHISPVVDPSTGFISWDVYIDRLYCKKDNFQVLCVPCHKLKSKEENESKRISKTSVHVRTRAKPKPRLSGASTGRGSGGSKRPVRKSSKGRKTN